MIHQKQTGAEKGVLNAADIDFYRREYDRLTKELENSFDDAKLPDMPTCREALNDLLIRLRLKDAHVASFDGTRV